MNKFIKVICIGRASLDLYAVEEGVAFEEVKTLRKSFGGSPANIAVGLSRLDILTGFIGKVSDDMIGSAVMDFLKKEGVDTAEVKFDKTNARTGVAITETRPENCRVVIYRDGVSDLLIHESEINETYISQARVLLVSGTSLSASPSREAVFHAVRTAKRHGVQIFTDLDYRPYSWKNPIETAEVYSEIANLSDYLVGNTEEFECFSALPDYNGVEEMIKNCLDRGCEWVIHKMGMNGSEAWSKSEKIRQEAFRVKAKKPFGAGDAFAASVIQGILEGFSMNKALLNASAAAAIVVSEFGCAESMPGKKQIQNFISENKNQ